MITPPAHPSGLLRLASALACLLALPACSTMVCRTGAIANFHALPCSPDIYRGGQPEGEAAWRLLQEHGVKHIVKLNSEDLAAEKKEARAHGIRVEEWPHLKHGQPDDFSLSQTRMFFTGPDEIKMAQLLSSIEPGTYIHCLHGQDRTGVVVAAYEVRVLGHKKGPVFQEMCQYGFRPLPGLLLWYLFAVHPPAAGATTCHEGAVPHH